MERPPPDRPSWLVRRFLPLVRVEVRHDAFTFSRMARSRTYPTRLSFRRDPKSKVWEIHEGAQTGPDIVELDLFEQSPHPPEAPARIECLAFLMRRGINCVLGGGFALFRPKVEVSGQERLSAVLAGYERTVLAEAIHLAGAADVEFG